MLKKEEAIPWPGTLAIVHSYIAYKAGRVTHTLSCVICPHLKKQKKYWKEVFALFQKGNLTLKMKS